MTYGSPRSRREAERLLFYAARIRPNYSHKLETVTDAFEVFMWCWDEISGRKVLATVPTKAEADEKLDEMSERFPHAYIDYRGVPE